MAEIIGVRFKNVGKIYYFDPDGKTLQQGDRVIVETARGLNAARSPWSTAMFLPRRSRSR